MIIFFFICFIAVPSVLLVDCVVRSYHCSCGFCEINSFLVLSNRCNFLSFKLSTEGVSMNYKGGL